MYLLSDTPREKSREFAKSTIKMEQFEFHSRRLAGENVRLMPDETNVWPPYSYIYGATK